MRFFRDRQIHKVFETKPEDILVGRYDGANNFISLSDDDSSSDSDLPDGSADGFWVQHDKHVNTGPESSQLPPNNRREIERMIDELLHPDFLSVLSPCSPERVAPPHDLSVHCNLNVVNSSAAMYSSREQCHAGKSSSSDLLKSILSDSPCQSGSKSSLKRHRGNTFRSQPTVRNLTRWSVRESLNLFQASWSGAEKIRCRWTCLIKKLKLL